MKQVLIFLGLFVMIASLFAQTAADFEVALTQDDSGVIIKNYIGKAINTIRIPATIEGLPVMEIGEEAFIGAGTVINYMGVMKADVPFAVVLPQGLIKIGDNAFADSALTSVVIPDSVTEIGARAFAFYDFYIRSGTLKPPDPLLTSITLPKGLTKVGTGAFSGNSALKTVVIPNGCSALGEDMFEGCTALTEIIIPKSITSIPSGAFARCKSLKSLVLPEGLTEISTNLPDSRKSYTTGAFAACTALTSVTLPSTIITMGERAFSACSALTTVTIPVSIERIDGGDNAYADKTLLEWAFPECVKLNLATQSRLKKIPVFSQKRERAEEERKQRAEEEQARRDKEWREREEWEAKVESEREIRNDMKSRVETLIRDVRANVGNILNSGQFTEFLIVCASYRDMGDDLLPEGNTNIKRIVNEFLDNNQRKQFYAKFYPDR